MTTGRCSWTGMMPTGPTVSSARKKSARGKTLRAQQGVRMPVAWGNLAFYVDKQVPKAG